MKSQNKVGLQDSLRPQGEFNVYLDYHNGLGKKLYYAEKNLIVKAAKQQILTSLYMENVMSDPIRTLKIGSGGAIDPAGMFPRLENPLQEDLVNPVMSVDAIYVVDLDNVMITYLADVDTDQGNGSIISEAGLFKLSTQMFNIKNHPGIPKTPEFSIHYEWRLKIL